MTPDLGWALNTMIDVLEDTGQGGLGHQADGSGGRAPPALPHAILGGPCDVSTIVMSIAGNRGLGRLSGMSKGTSY